MKNFTIPLTKKELYQLSDFLLDRIDEDADTEDKDEGILDVSSLDGFFTAIVSGPETLMPSQWLPAVWGDFEPIWNTQREAGEILNLMIRHMNGIASMLMERPLDFEPIFMERQAEGKIYTIVDEWCEGYWRGMMLSAEHWQFGMEDIGKRLVPIGAFTEVTNWQGHELAEKKVISLQKEIAVSAREIHAYWLSKRDKLAPATIDQTPPGLRAGRNDPCPCGSGRKFKKCCLQ